VAGKRPSKMLAGFVGWYGR